MQCCRLSCGLFTFFNQFFYIVFQCICYCSIFIVCNLQKRGAALIVVKESTVHSSARFIIQESKSKVYSWVMIFFSIRIYSLKLLFHPKGEIESSAMAYLQVVNCRKQEYHFTCLALNLLIHKLQVTLQSLGLMSELDLLWKQSQ